MPFNAKQLAVLVAVSAATSLLVLAVANRTQIPFVDPGTPGAASATTQPTGSPR